KVDCLSFSGHGTIQIDLLSFPLQIRLGDSPRGSGRPRVTLPVLLELWDGALHPAHKRRMYNLYVPLGHDCHHVTIAQFVREVPPDAQDKDGAVKMTALAEAGEIVNGMVHD